MNSIYDTPEYKERWAMYQSALTAGIPIVSTETCLLTLNQQREDRVPDHIDQMFKERYGFHFNRD